MVEITVSCDNFNALLNAQEKEHVIIKHKNLHGEICLEKLYDKLPKKQSELIAIESVDHVAYTDNILRYIRDGYSVSSTSCSDGMWRAILVRGGNV